MEILYLASIRNSHRLCNHVPNPVVTKRPIITRTLLFFILGPMAYFPSELIWNYGACRQSVGLLGWVIRLVERPLPTQENTNTKETLKYIHAFSEIRIHDPILRRSEDISCLRPYGQCDQRITRTALLTLRASYTWVQFILVAAKIIMSEIPWFKADWFFAYGFLCSLDSGSA
jgi:hypothetical protein